MAKSLNITVWVIQSVLALMIGGSGVAKLAEAGWIEQLATWGYPDHFVYGLGVAEIVGAIGLFSRPVMTYAGLLCAAIMIGATSTHLMNGAGVGTIVGHLLLIVLLMAVAFLKRPPILGGSEREIQDD